MLPFSDELRIFEANSDGLIITDAESGLIVEINSAAATMHGYARAELPGLHHTTLMSPESHPLFDEYLQVAHTGAVFEMCERHLRRDGSLFYGELRGRPFTYQGRRCLLSAIRDVSQRVEAEQQLQQQVEARIREQATLLDLSQTLASALDFRPELILDQLQVLVEYTQAALFSLEELTLTALAARGSARLEEAMPLHIWLDGPQTTERLLKRHLATHLTDGESADAAAESFWSLLRGQAGVLLEEMKVWLWVPLAVQGRVMGGVLIARSQGEPFTAHQADLAQTMANQAAITMVNAHLYEQAQTLAILEERQRLAHTLHDAINQSLFSAGLIAEVLPRLWEQNPEDARHSLEDLRRLTIGAAAEMRGLLAELRPLALIDAELDDLLRQLGNALTGRTNIPVFVTAAGQGSLPAEVQVTFYRLCQEALNNIARHAEASRVEIALRYEADAVELCIRDDGRGFDPEHIPPDHFGLSIMRERADAVGVFLAIASQPGQGTTITVRWRVDPEQEAFSP